jgi:hypothetical protein
MKKCERDDVVHHYMNGQLSMANARFPSFGQHLVNFRYRECFGDDAKADEIRGPPEPSVTAVRAIEPCLMIRKVSGSESMVNKALTSR